MNFLIFWAVVGLVSCIGGLAHWDFAQFKNGEERDRQRKRGRRVTFTGLAIFLICGSLAALAQDLTS